MTISNTKDGQKAVGLETDGLETGGGEWAQLAGRELPTWYDDDKLGVFVHWGPYSVPRWAPQMPGRLPVSPAHVARLNGDVRLQSRAATREGREPSLPAHHPG